MAARGIGVVLESQSDRVQQGSHVITASPNVWDNLAIFEDCTVTVVRPSPHSCSETHYLGALGGTGLKAYFGLVVVGDAKEGEKIVISSAAGATSSMVVQIAKHIVGPGRVISIAPSDEKTK